MIRKYLILLSAALLSVSTAAFVACDKGEDTPTNNNGGNNGDDPTPEGMNLLGLCDRLIAEQRQSGTRSRVYVVAHRGNTYEGVMQNIPDNSVPNIEKAIEKGADMVELDVRTTKDNVLILMHNATIDETTTGSGAVSELTYDEILRYDMRKGSNTYKDAQGNTIKVPTLEQALLACKDKIYVNLDLGGKNVPVGKLVRTLQQTGTASQVMLYIGGDYALAKEYQYKDVNIAVHPFISKAEDVSVYENLPGAKLFQYTNTLYLGNDREIGRKIRKAGYLSYSNLLDVYDRQMLKNDYTALDAFIASESDFVQTDYVELVSEYLQKQGLR